MHPDAIFRLAQFRGLLGFRSGLYSKFVVMRPFLLFLSASLAAQTVTISVPPATIGNAEAVVNVSATGDSQPYACTYRACQGTGCTLGSSSIDDLNTTYFPGANSETRTVGPNHVADATVNGANHQFPLGHRIYDKAASGIWVSRALQAAAPTTVGVTCGSAAEVTTTFTTLTIPFGESWQELPPTDARAWHNLPVPTPDWTPGSGQDWRTRDAQTGALIARMTGPLNRIVGQQNQATFAYAEDLSGGGWTNPNNALTNQVSSTLASTNTVGAPLFLAWSLVDSNMAALWQTNAALVDIRLRAYGYGVGPGGTGSPTLQACIPIATTTCDSAPISFTLAAGGKSSAAAETLVNSKYPSPVLSAWAPFAIPPGQALIANVPASQGTKVTTGGTGNKTLTHVGGGVHFSTDWPVGARVRINGTCLAHIAAPGPSQFTMNIDADCGALTNVSFEYFGAGIRVWMTAGTSANVSFTFDELASSNITGYSNAAYDIASSLPISDISTDRFGNPTPPQTGYLMQIQPYSAGLSLFIPATGENRLLSGYFNSGTTQQNPGCRSGCYYGYMSASNQTFSATDPKSLMISGATNVVYKATLNQSGVYKEFIPLANPPLDSNMLYSVLGGDRSVSTQLASQADCGAFPATCRAAKAYATGLFSPFTFDGAGGGYVYYRSATGGDTHPAIVAVTAEATNTLVQAYTTWDTYPMRWGGQHFPHQTIQNQSYIGLNDMSNTDGLLGGPWILDIAGMWHDGGGVAGTGTYVANSFPITAVANGASSLGSVTINNGGTGYQPGDVLTVVQNGASNGTVQVSAVANGGVITGLFPLGSIGTGYSTASGLSVSGGNGSGATVNVTSITGNATFTVPGLTLVPYFSDSSEGNACSLPNTHCGPRVTIAGGTGSWAAANGIWVANVNLSSPANTFSVPGIAVSNWGAYPGGMTVSLAPALMNSQVQSITGTSPAVVTAFPSIGGRTLTTNGLMDGDSIDFNTGVQYFAHVTSPTQFSVWSCPAMSGCPVPASKLSGALVVHFTELCPSGLPDIVTSGQYYDTGATGNRCVALRVTGPCDPFARGAEQAAYPPAPGCRPGSATLQSIAPGDTFQEYGHNNGDEKFVIVKVTPAGDTMQDIVAMRFFGNRYTGSGDNSTNVSGGSHDFGWTPHMTLPASTLSGGFSGYVEVPSGAVTVNSVISNCHSDIGYGWPPGMYSYAGCGNGGFDAVTNMPISPLMKQLLSPASLHNNCPYFAGNSASALGCRTSETYSAARTKLKQADFKTDWHALNPDSGGDIGGGSYEFSDVTPPALVSGKNNIYLMSLADGHKPASVNIKTTSYMGWAGGRVFIPKSGPGVTLADADTDRYCVVYAAGDCVAGSLPGQIYASFTNTNLKNSDGSPVNYCVTNSYDQAVACVAPLNYYGGWATQDQIVPVDTTATKQRRLTFGLAAPFLHADYQTQYVEPTGTWSLFPTPPSNGLRSDYYGMLLTPEPANQVNIPALQTFVPVTIPVASYPGANQALVIYGYTEYGGQYFCNQLRQENCVAATPTNAGHTADTYAFATSDTYSYTNCSSGCTIKMNVLSSHAANWQIQYYNNGTFVANGVSGIQMAVPQVSANK